MKEEEARTKECPFKHGEVSCVSNNNCTTSSCIMWEKDIETWVQDDELKARFDGGHCGLAK